MGRVGVRGTHTHASLTRPERRANGGRERRAGALGTARHGTDGRTFVRSLTYIHTYILYPVGADCEKRRRRNTLMVAE